MNEHAIIRGVRRWRRRARRTSVSFLLVCATVLATVWWSLLYEDEIIREAYINVESGEYDEALAVLDAYRGRQEHRVLRWTNLESPLPSILAVLSYSGLGKPDVRDAFSKAEMTCANAGFRKQLCPLILAETSARRADILARERNVNNWGVSALQHLEVALKFNPTLEAKRSAEWLLQTRDGENGDSNQVADAQRFRDAFKAPFALDKPGGTSGGDGGTDLY
jgi:hypothetical protein